MSEKLSERCLTSSQTIPPVLPALVRQHPPVISSVAGGSLEMRHRLPDRLGRVGELKGGGKAGGAGWRERVAFRQTGSPPSETARMASRVSASAKEPSGLWPQPLGGRNHSPPNFPEIVLPFSAWKRRLRLEKMACNLTKPTPGNSAMRPKNRVWGVSRNDRNLPLENRLRCPELRRKSGPTPTFFTPGIPQWPSRDPIEERGGLNLYGFISNDGAGRSDFLGREEQKHTIPKELTEADYQKLKDDGTKLLQGLCENKKCLGECGCTKETCQKEAKSIAEMAIKAYRIAANHPKGWGSIPGNSNNAGEIHRGWVCYQWQQMMFRALFQLHTKCFKLSGGAAGQEIDGDMNWVHNWVDISLWSFNFKADVEANKITPPPKECQARLDAWVDYAPKFFTPEKHGFVENAWADLPMSRIVTTYYFKNGLLLVIPITHTHWLEEVQDSVIYETSKQ